MTKLIITVKKGTITHIAANTDDVLIIILDFDVLQNGGELEKEAYSPDEVIGDEEMQEIIDKA